MDAKVATYTEKNVRIQLIAVYCDETNVDHFEIRRNRKIINRFSPDQATLSRYVFSDMVKLAIVHRTLVSLSNLT